MTPLASNPYIVGNPIKTREMFFGREDDFLFVSRKIGEGESNRIVVLCGERRSGKTSILFQIMGGRLGGGFLPILIDMQMLAGTKGDREFFRAILRNGYVALQGLGIEEVAPASRDEHASVELLMESFLAFVREKAPNKTPLFLLDEYELIEAKIRDGTLSESTVTYLAGVLESAYPASFIFTGSTNLEDRNPAIWRMLLGKSVYRKISYLSHGDTVRLIKEPLRDSVTYSSEVVESICRLSGGQPFYTQVICQNLIDLLIDENRADPSAADVDRIVREIVANPLPQMIYAWNNFPAASRIALSSLAGTLGNESSWADCHRLIQYMRENRIAVPFTRERGNILLEDAYHRELLEKNDTAAYRFRMDVLRRWIQREHSIWKVVKEADIGFRRSLRAVLLPVLSGLGGAVILAAAWLLLVPRVFPGLGAWGRSVGLLPQTRTSATEPALHDVKNISFTANRGPFTVMVDGVYPHGSSESPLGSTWILVQSLSTGSHDFVASGPEGEVVSLLEQAVSPTSRSFLFSFAPTELQASEIGSYLSSAESSPASIAKRRRALELGYSIVVLVTEPPGASVQVANDIVGVTPIALDMNAGFQLIFLTLAGYKPQNMSITTRAGGAYLQNLTMQENRTLLAFEGTGQGSVLIDGQWITDLPTTRTRPVESGTHVLTILDSRKRVVSETTVDLVAATVFTVRGVAP